MIAILMLLSLRILTTGWLVTTIAWAVIEADCPMPTRTRFWRAVTWWPCFLRRPALPDLWHMLRCAASKLRYYAAFRRR